MTFRPGDPVHVTGSTAPHRVDRITPDGVRCVNLTAYPPQTITVHPDRIEHR